MAAAFLAWLPENSESVVTSLVEYIPPPSPVEVEVSEAVLAELLLMVHPVTVRSLLEL